MLQRNRLGIVTNFDPQLCIDEAQGLLRHPRAPHAVQVTVMLYLTCLFTVLLLGDCQDSGIMANSNTHHEGSVVSEFLCTVIVHALVGLCCTAYAVFPINVLLNRWPC